MKILITGSGGFIGAALTNRFLKNGDSVVGIDNLNAYYEKSLKLARLKNIYQENLNSKSKWIFEEFDLEDYEKLESIFLKIKPDIVINLAAQAGVRYSINNPKSYIKSNIVGFQNIIQLCAKYEVSNFLFASSSSVYGGNKKLPFKEDQLVSHPINLYAATKISNELIAHSYSHLYKLSCTGLRFFTVYGPWGRPDMAPMIFTKSIIEEKVIDIYNFGKMRRDFTFIDDIVDGIFLCAQKPAEINKSFYDSFFSDPSSSFAPFNILNIGNGNPINLLDFINELENQLGKKAIKNFVEIQPGEIVDTIADISKISKWVNFSPKVNFKKGIKLFVRWYLNYYK